MQAEFAADPDFVYSERITMQQSVALLRVPTNLLVFIQGLFGCLPWGVLLTYLTDYLAQNKGLSVPTATVVRPCSTPCHSCSVCLLAGLHAVQFKAKDHLGNNSQMSKLITECLS